MPWKTFAYDAAAMRRQSRLWSAALASTVQQTMWGRIVQQLAADPPPQPPQEITTMGNPMNHLDAALARSARRVEDAKRAAKPPDPVKFVADDHQPDGTVNPIAKPAKPPLGPRRTD